MYYINSNPSESGNYGNPQSNPFPGCAILPDELLSGYIEARGFVFITVEGSTVTSLEVNQEALDAYLEENPDVPDEPAEAHSPQDDTDAMLIDHELRLTLLELGL